MLESLKYKDLIAKFKARGRARKLLSIAEEFESQLTKSSEQQPGRAADHTSKTAHLVYNTG
jgi:hypothetical protein